MATVQGVIPASPAAAPMPATPTATPTQSTQHRQIPIVCPGHTRPLAELQFRSIKEPATKSDDAAEAKEGEERILLVSACHDKMPMVRDGRSGDWIGTFVGHKGAVWSTRLDPQGYLAATASGDFSVRVWDAVTGEGLWLLNHKHIVKSVDFSHDSKRLATGGHEGLLRIYDLLNPAFGLTTAAAKSKGNNNNKKDAGPPSEVKVEEAQLSIPQSPDKKITISKCLWYDNSTVIAAGDDGCVRLWHIPATNDAVTDPTYAGHSLLRTIPVEAGVGIRDMELSFVPSPSHGTAPIPVLAVAAGDHVYFYNLADTPNDTPLKKWKMPIHFRNEGGASLHPSGKYFIAGGSDLWVRVFEYDTGKELECNKGHHGPIRCLRYAPDGNTYATGSEDGTIRLWKTFP